MLLGRWRPASPVLEAAGVCPEVSCGSLSNLWLTTAVPRTQHLALAKESSLCDPFLSLAGGLRGWGQAALPGCREQKLAGTLSPAASGCTGVWTRCLAFFVPSLGQTQTQVRYPVEVCARALNTAFCQRARLKARMPRSRWLGAEINSLRARTCSAPARAPPATRLSGIFSCAGCTRLTLPSSPAPSAPSSAQGAYWAEAQTP